MSQLTAERIKNAVAGALVALDSTDATLVKTMLFRRLEKARMFDAATAGTAMTTTAFWTNTTGATMRVIAAYVVTPVTVAADNTDYVTFTLSQALTDNTGAATVATSTTKAADLNGLTALVKAALPITAANQDVPDGSELRIAVAKAGSGKAITAATSDAYVIVVLEPIS